MARSHHPAIPLKRGHMPSGFDISIDAYTNNHAVRIPADYGPKQALSGFDPDYRNIIDYIVRITHRIWEDRDVEYIADCYSPDSRVFDDYGLQTGNAKIISDTHHTTGAFSDIVLDAEEVVWAGNDQVGFRSSHRTRILGTNDGDSKYGVATGKPVDLLVIANCVSKANDIFLEHVLYNTSGMLMQLGIDPLEEAKRLAENPLPGWPRSVETWAMLKSEGGPSQPLSQAEPVNGFDPDRFARKTHANLYLYEDFEALRACYAEALSFEGTSLRKSDGFDGWSDQAHALLTTLSDRRFQVDEVYWMGNDNDGYLISTRWSMDATYSGAGFAGSATDKPVQVWGITQQEIKDGIITREWMLFNELDVMIQCAAARE
ncbi:MAG: ester cyclase [Pseudomonadota bacterium]